MITNGSSCGCFSPHESFPENVTSGLSDLACFVQIGSVCILFTCLAYALLSDLDEPPATNPLAIVRISPATASLFLVLVGDFYLHLEVDSHLRLSGTYNVDHFAPQTSLVFLTKSNRSDSSNHDTCPYHAHDPYGNGNTYSYFSPLDYFSLAWATSEWGHFLPVLKFC